MPPPNVTGSLHIGHALDNTLQDVLTRRERMLGKDALVGRRHRPCRDRHADGGRAQPRQPGHQARRHRPRGFLEHVWEWKAQSGGAITRQLRRLGASCDWAHERFTMDERYQRAVTHAFVELHKRGLIYRDKRLVNWDPKFQTAISDLEVETAKSTATWALNICDACSYPLDATGSRARSRSRSPHAARDDARRRGGRGPPGRRALPADRRQAFARSRSTGHAPDPDHHRRAIPIPISARARSRSPAGTTSTIMSVGKTRTG